MTGQLGALGSLGPSESGLPSVASAGFPYLGVHPLAQQCLQAPFISGQSCHSRHREVLPRQSGRAIPARFHRHTVQWPSAVQRSAASSRHVPTGPRQRIPSRLLPASARCSRIPLGSGRTGRSSAGFASRPRHELHGAVTDALAAAAHAAARLKVLRRRRLLWQQRGR